MAGRVAANLEIAERFREIADLLDLLGERFKPEAYRRAARSLESLTEDLATIVARDGLSEIPGIGEALGEKIREYLRDGRIVYRDRLAGEVPPGIVALLKVPGLGPKTVRRFWTDLGVDGPETLRAALDAGRLTGVSGFGPKKIAQIRAALSAGVSEARTPLWEASAVGERLREALRAQAPVDQIELAGSLRRARESVGDLDLLVTSRSPEKVLDAFGRLPEVREIRLRGDTKETVLLDTGLQVDLRVVAPESFGAAWQYFTGSKDHNVRLRTRAQKLGLRVNEYGVLRGEERIAGATEAEVYRSLGLAWIPPEIREDRGEIDAAETGKVPALIEPTDLRGDLHVHLPDGATEESVRVAVASAREAGHRFIGLVLPHGADRDGAARLRTSAPADPPSPRVYWGIEREEGSATSDLDTDLDFCLITPPGPEPPGPGTALPSPALKPVILAHLSLDRSGLGDSDAARADRWLRWAGPGRVGLELPPTAARGGLDSAAARTANDRGVPVWITGRVEPRRLAVAVALARRAGIGPSGIRNARDGPLDDAPEVTRARPGSPAGPSSGRSASPRKR